MWVYITIFIMIFLILIVLNSIVAKNQYIYKFLSQYKKDREIFFRENIEKWDENNPTFTIDIEKFERDSIEAKTYLQDKNIDDISYPISQFGKTGTFGVIKNLNVFPDKNLYDPNSIMKLTILLRDQGQRIIEEGVYEYKNSSTIKISPTYWILKNKKLEDLDVNPNKQSSIISFILSILLTIIINVLSNFIAEFINNIL